MGEIEVNGVKYNNVMPPPGIPPAHLQINKWTCLLTYATHGEPVSAVTESEVKNVRLDVKDRPAMQMWTAQELNLTKSLIFKNERDRRASIVQDCDDR